AAPAARRRRLHPGWSPARGRRVAGRSPLLARRGRRGASPHPRAGVREAARDRGTDGGAPRGGGSLGAAAGFRPPLALAQLDPPDLAARRLRQRVDELDLARILVARGDTLHVLLERAHELRTRLLPGREHDERLHHLATHGIGTRDHRRLDDRGMLEERALDLERADAVAGRDDHVVRAADEPEVAVVVAAGAIAGQIPLAAPARGRSGRIFPV